MSTSMSEAPLTEVPSGLKQLARLVVRGFYGLEESLLLDMLVRFPCMREDDLAELVKFDKKVLRARMASLKNDRLVQVKQRIESDIEAGDNKVVKMNCYFINYRTFVNVVKYKLDHMHKKMETSERDATNRANFKCLQCGKTFTDLEADQLFDPHMMEFRCTFCSGSVEEDEAAGPQKDSRQQLARFNEQMERLYDLLKIVENVKLVPGLLDPEPVDFSAGADQPTIPGAMSSGAKAPADGQGRWSGEATRSTGGFKASEQQVAITFDTENDEAKRSASRTKREVPIWIAQSAVANEDEEASNLSGVFEDAVVNLESNPDDTRDETNDSRVQEENSNMESDEITSLLLRHERTTESSNANRGQSDSSDNEESNQGRERNWNEVDNDDDDDDLEDDDDDDGNSIPVVKVGDEEIAVTDVNEQVIAKMTAEEKERYTQVFQDFYAHLYD